MQSAESSWEISHQEEKCLPEFLFTLAIFFVCVSETPDFLEELPTTLQMLQAFPLI